MDIVRNFFIMLLFGSFALFAQPDEPAKALNNEAIISKKTAHILKGCSYAALAIASGVYSFLNIGCTGLTLLDDTSLSMDLKLMKRSVEHVNMFNISLFNIAAGLFVTFKAGQSARNHFAQARCIEQ